MELETTIFRKHRVGHLEKLKSCWEWKCVLRGCGLQKIAINQFFEVPSWVKSTVTVMQGNRRRFTHNPCFRRLVGYFLTFNSDCNSSYLMSSASTLSIFDWQAAHTSFEVFTWQKLIHRLARLLLDLLHCCLRLSLWQYTHRVPFHLKLSELNTDQRGGG